MLDLPEATVCRIQPFDQALRDNRDTLEELWLRFVRSWRHPCRVITHMVPIDLLAPQRVLQARKRELLAEQLALEPIAETVGSWTASTPARLSLLRSQLAPAHQALLDRALRKRDPARRQDWIAALDWVRERYWKVELIEDYSYHFEQLNETLNLRGLQHYWVAWLPPETQPDVWVQETQRGFGTPARLEADLPPFIRSGSDYEEAADHLAPIAPDLPYIALLVVAAFVPEQEWTVETLRCLLDQDIDVDLCIDIGAKPLWWQKYRADQEEALRDQDANAAIQNRDRRAAKKRAGAAAIADALDDQQQLHEIRAVIAVKADTLEALNVAVETLTLTCSSVMELVRPVGSQAALTRFFDTTLTSQITAFAPMHLEPSHGVAVMLPWGYERPDCTEGVLYGIAHNAAPIMFDPVTDARGEKIPGHTLIAGATGTGKTTMGNGLTLRFAALDYQVCVVEPQGHAEQLIAACGAHASARRYVLSMNEQINPLDVAIGRDELDRPPLIAQQAQIVINRLATLLGVNVPGADGRPTFRTHVWDIMEVSILKMGLALPYAPWKHTLDQLHPSRTPLLADVCDALRTLDLGDRGLNKIRDRVLHLIWLALVKGPDGETFNHPTSVEWDFSRDIVAYNLMALEDGPAKTLTIDLVLGAINTYVRSQERDRSRPFVSMWDELGVTLKKIPQLAAALEEYSRAWRTFRGMVIGMDQHLSTWMDGSLRVFFDQAPNKIILYQSSSQAAQLDGLVDGVQPEHLAGIPLQQRGDFTLFRKDYQGMQTNRVYVGHFQLTPLEWARLHGT